MIPNPRRLLAGHRVLHTRSLDELNAYIAGMEGSHERQLSGDGPVEVELRHARLGRIDVGLHHSSVSIMVKATRRSSDDFLIQFPLTGKVDLQIDGHELRVTRESGVILSPGQCVLRTGGPGWTLAFKVAGDLMRSRLVQRSGHSVKGPLSFQPLISPACDEIRNFCLLMVEAVDRGVAAEGSAMAMVLEEGLADLLLILQPHSQGKVLVESAGSARIERVRAVEDYLDGHLQAPISVEELAREVGCGVRSLQNTFTEFCGMSPMEFVRRRRFSLARRMLESGDESLSIGGVARHVGFRHLARFSAGYKAIYGESPTDTRRRARAKADAGIRATRP